MPSSRFYKINRFKQVGIMGIKCGCCRPTISPKQHRRSIRASHTETTRLLIKEAFDEQEEALEEALEEEFLDDLYTPFDPYEDIHILWH